MTKHLLRVTSLLKRAKIVNAHGEAPAAAALGQASDPMMAHHRLRRCATCRAWRQRPDPRQPIGDQAGLGPRSAAHEQCRAVKPRPPVSRWTPGCRSQAR